MSQLIIEIVEGHDYPTARTIMRGTANERMIYEQKAYMHNGGAFPQEFRITFDKPDDIYKVGKYVLDTTSFQTGRYGDLELKRNLVLKPALQSDLKQAN